MRQPAGEIFIMHGTWTLAQGLHGGPTCVPALGTCVHHLRTPPVTGRNGGGTNLRHLQVWRVTRSRCTPACYLDQTAAAGSSSLLKQGVGKGVLHHRPMSRGCGTSWLQLWPAVTCERRPLQQAAAAATSVQQLAIYNLWARGMYKNGSAVCFVAKQSRVYKL